MFIEPSVFDEPCPLAFQFQATYVCEFSFTPPPLPTVNPSLSKEIKDCVSTEFPEVKLLSEI